jgi:hypothetical protein
MQLFYFVVGQSEIYVAWHVSFPFARAQGLVNNPSDVPTEME